MPLFSHAAPFPPPAFVRGTAVPPAIWAFFSLPSATKTSHLLSGENTGWSACTVPGSGIAANWSTGLT